MEVTMHRNVLAAASAALALIVSAGAAAIAQSSPYANVARAGAYYWQGAYVGANVGYQWGSVRNNPTNPSGPAGGLQAGYNFQINQFVFGGETDLQFSGADDTFAPWKFSNPWFGTLRGRAGVAMNNILFYGTVGLAYGNLKAQSTLSGVTESKIHGGWAAGFGLEVGLTGNWMTRAEYLYIDLSDRAYGLTGANHGLESSLLRLGMYYRF
jgi:outer membrane immunogenic protein